MHHEVTVVEKNPVARLVALDMVGPDLVGPQPLHNGVGDGPHLALAVAATDQEVVGERTDFAQLQDSQILALAILHRDDGMAASGRDVGWALNLAAH